jgi:Skp family chaperone for outer membrane proteins
MFVRRKEKNMNLRTFALALVLAAASQLSLADDTGKAAAKDVSRKLEDSGKAIGSYTIAERDQAIKSAQAALADADARMRRMERKMDREWDKMDDAARKRARETMDTLRRQRNDAAEWLGGIKHGSAEAWDEVKGGFVKSYEVLKRSFAKAAREL